MIRDPEEIRDRRRAAEPASVPGTENGPCEPTAGQRATDELLARLRAGDDLAEPTAWLCGWRGDRRPLEEIAADAGRTVDEVRAGIDAALHAEGSSFAAVEAARRRPRVLGKSLMRQQQLVEEADQAEQNRRQQFVREHAGQRE